MSQVPCPHHEPSCLVLRITPTPHSARRLDLAFSEKELHVPRTHHSLSLAILMTYLFGVSAVEAADRKKGDRDADAKTEIALHYDFYGVEGDKVADQAKPPHDGTIHGGQIVDGKRKPAVKLDGNGSLSVSGEPSELNPAGRSFSVGALCRPESPDGVLVAMGDRTNGFSLYLRGGVPHFAVRSAGELTLLVGDKPVQDNQWLHLMGTVSSQGQIILLVNAWPAAEMKGKLIAEQPTKPLSVGADPSGEIAGTGSIPNWRGLVEDVRLYWGVMDRNEHREELGDWADRPGCGCR